MKELGYVKLRSNLACWYSAIDQSTKVKTNIIVLSACDDKANAPIFRIDEDLDPRTFSLAQVYNIDNALRDFLGTEIRYEDCWYQIDGTDEDYLDELLLRLVVGVERLRSIDWDNVYAYYWDGVELCDSLPADEEVTA